eukprot:1468199-Pleurochrysis_carterae.AAC.1
MAHLHSMQSIFKGKSFRIKFAQTQPTQTVSAPFLEQVRRIMSSGAQATTAQAIAKRWTETYGRGAGRSNEVQVHGIQAGTHQAGHRRFDIPGDLLGETPTAAGRGTTRTAAQQTHVFDLTSKMIKDAYYSGFCYNEDAVPRAEAYCELSDTHLARQDFAQTAYTASSFFD